MAILYKSTCNSCSEEREISWGDGMFYLQYQCDCCLKLFHLPRKAPRQNRNGREVPKFLEKHGFESHPPKSSEEITRFTDKSLKMYLENPTQWQHGDDQWDSYEIEKIISLVSCGCISVLHPTSERKIPKLNCQSCNTSRLITHTLGMSD